jgi:hypothetical protein
VRRHAQTLLGLDGFSNKNRACRVRCRNIDSMRSIRRGSMYGESMLIDFSTSSGERDNNSDLERMDSVDVDLSILASC